MRRSLEGWTAAAIVGGFLLVCGFVFGPIMLFDALRERMRA